MVLASRPLTSGNWTESALKVLRERYLWREGGEVRETPEDMCWRVAYTIAGAERRHGADEDTVREYAHRFFELMIEGVFLPNSPTLMNAGKENGLQFSACYVLPVEDSLEGIFETIKRAALIHKSGGGTGFSFSRLRSKDSIVSSTGGKASGPVSFLRVFNAATEAVKQGGTRRGANMGILRIDHPDVLEFIDCKNDGGILNFNISIAVTDAFMQALADGADYDLIDPQSKATVGKLSARMVFDKLVDSAWATGDPGVVFIDRINKSPANPTPDVWEIEATNPCGEQPLAPNEACNLGSLNLAKFVLPGSGLPSSRIDWASLEKATKLSIRFLDDVIDENPYPLPEIDDAVKANRRVGLGIMGWSDLLLELGIPYDSEAATDLASSMMAAIRRAAHESSEELAAVRGPFLNWSRSIYRHGKPKRNSTVTTIAPTGTISIIAGCSSGIEPMFAIAYSHIAPGSGRHLTFVNPIFERLAKERGFWSEELMEKIASQGTLHGIDEVPEDVRRVFVTAHEVAPLWHVRMQGAWQAHTDNAVSKTINLPNNATRDDVADAYRLAYELGCLGITVFRDGCKGEAAQVLHLGTGGLQGAPKPEGATTPEKRRNRPNVVTGYTRQLGAPEGKVNVTLNSDDDGLLEVFVNVGKAGSDIAALAEAVGRLVSLAFQLPSQMPPDDRAREVAKQLRGIGGSRTVGFGPAQVRSLPDAVAQALELHLGEHRATAIPGPTQEGSVITNGGGHTTNGNGLPANRGGTASPYGTTSGGAVALAIRQETIRLTGNLCPDCGCNSLANIEGCRKCEACGYSEC